MSTLVGILNELYPYNLRLDMNLFDEAEMDSWLDDNGIVGYDLCRRNDHYDIRFESEFEYTISYIRWVHAVADRI